MIILISMLNLARVVTDLKRYHESEALLSAAISKAEKILLPNHPLLASMHVAYGDYAMAVNNPEKAKAEYLQARSIWLTRLIQLTNALKNSMHK